MAKIILSSITHYEYEYDTSKIMKVRYDYDTTAREVLPIRYEYDLVSYS